MDNVYSDIRRFVADKVNTGVIVRTDWLVSEYMGRKSDIKGGDLPFYRACAVAHLNDVVRKVIGKYEGKDEPEEAQIVLPGFKHLQVAYPVKRDGKKALVPISKMTWDEMIAYEEMLAKQARGCVQHRKEMRRYRLENEHRLRQAA